MLELDEALVLEPVVEERLVVEALTMELAEEEV